MQLVSNSIKERATMQMYLVLFLLVLVGCVMVPAVGFADSYEVYLYYDNGSLVFDRNFSQKVARIPGGTGPIFEGTFEAQVLDINGGVLQSIKFDPQPGAFVEGRGYVAIPQGEQAIRLPYTPTGTILQIFDDNKKKILEHNISYLSECNGDGTCSFGESAATCPGDCVSPTQTGTDSPRSSLWLWVLLILAVVAGISFLIWRQRKASQTSLP